MAYVIGEDCISCGTCAGECPVEAISEGAERYVVLLRLSACPNLLRTYRIKLKCSHLGGTLCF